MMNKHRYVLGICGGSGSGKTYMVSQLIKSVSAGSVSVLSQDSYYKDLSHLPTHERSSVNFDHPDAIDFNLLRDDLESLITGVVVNQPVYDFNSHTKTNSSVKIEPAPIIIIEGHHIFFHDSILQKIDYKVFIDIEMDIRFIRRMVRDMKERGRDVKSIIQQYLDTVRPMDLEFIQPAKSHADSVITSKNYEETLSEIVQLLNSFIFAGKVPNE